MSIDRISIGNGAIDRTLQSNGIDETKSKSQSRHSNARVSDDAVSLSDSARNADRLANMVDNTRSNRLDAVREAIANGTYHVSGTDIASKLIKLNTR